MKSDEIIKSIGTKEKGSNSQKKKIKQLEKQYKREHWFRLNTAKEYSVQLMKVFGNKLLNFVK
jgi:Na+/phosphate symporter